ncbi:hypothetical protein PsYK624_135080 [Phanerochaete sordida]|uniref:Uncharacterized protein n=1 Tax=Phanerochaete sordida TaxID=48140 RepID=A0A9P3GL36_9APHY|nr:hypothetical protein PsYK624_135080 [Phanerochaete sordida]
MVVLQVVRPYGHGHGAPRGRCMLRSPAGPVPPTGLHGNPADYLARLSGAEVPFIDEASGICQPHAAPAVGPGPSGRENSTTIAPHGEGWVG